MPDKNMCIVAARALVLREGRALLVRRSESDIRFPGVWELPGGRLELGVGTGGTPESFAAFGITNEDRSAVYARHLAVVRDAWAGRERGEIAGIMLRNRIVRGSFRAGPLLQAVLAGVGARKKEIVRGGVG